MTFITFRHGPISGDGRGRGRGLRLLAVRWRTFSFEHIPLNLCIGPGTTQNPQRYNIMYFSSPHLHTGTWWQLFLNLNHRIFTVNKLKRGQFLWFKSLFHNIIFNYLFTLVILSKDITVPLWFYPLTCTKRYRKYNESKQITEHFFSSFSSAPKLIHR